MAYIPGGTLKQRLGEPMDMRWVVRVMKDIASALAYAHERGVIHRDVKPVNVLLDTDGRAVLTDFGIAKILYERDGLTHAGAGVGTPEYMSPEQCRGGTVDARADIYAMGIMLYEMLTGHTPFEADNYTALAHAHIYEPVPLPSRLNPRISPAVQAVVMKALSKEPQDRFQHPVEMARTLEQAVAAQMPVVPAATTRPFAEGASALQPYGQQGAALPLSVLCPQCQALNAPDKRFCTRCGSRLPTPSLPQVGVGAAVPGGARPPYVTCVSCHAANPASNRFCTQCGAPLAAGGPRCKRCGATNARGQHFCATCGTPLEVV
jgi:serine/threonine-protein kinase